ncbi:glycosyltransferase family 2 protein [Sphaerotilus microaerophilus]|uniref:glycosyltransferase family 2 protein n=1 Tax=Sphaerotilus microaerophilus TaxID=2914710 RepID=UPI0020749703|nr:glycosyltransferase [Sphaerotilus sp. FB-5]
MNDTLTLPETENRPVPKVSVCVVTYNQKDFIAQCIQSLVDQKTNFPFEIIISDDCSTDGTSGVISEFKSKYSHMIRSVRHEKNIGAYKNFVFAHTLASGEYIAHVDGDDYALPGKLQAQSDFLDKNPDCNISWHRMLVKNESTGLICEDLFDCSLIPSNGFSRADIIRFITLGSNSSKMYRKQVRDFQIPDFPVVDYFANVEQIGTGSAWFISDKPFGVYRAGIGIASAGLTTRRLLASCFTYFGKKYPQHKRQVGSASLLLFVAALKNKNWPVAKIFLGPTLQFSRIQSALDLIKYRNILSTLRIPPSIRHSK